MGREVKLMIVGLLMVILQPCLCNASDDLKYTRQLAKSFIVSEFEVKNVSAVEACKKLNALFIKHQKTLGLSKFGIVQVSLQDTPAIHKTNVYLHVKNVKLTTILGIICEQNNLSFRIEKNEIVIFYPIK